MKRERHLRKRQRLEDKSADVVEIKDTSSQVSVVEGIKALQKHRAQQRTQHEQNSPTAKRNLSTEERDVLDAYVKETTLKSASQSEEMDHYIEYHMKQRLGQVQDRSGKALSLDEQRDKELFEMPDNLKAQSSGPREVSIPGLMTGISEVRLPTSCRLKNIEDTEEAKAAILETGSLERLKPKKRRTKEQEEEEDSTGIKRSMFATSFGRVSRK